MVHTIYCVVEALKMRGRYHLIYSQSKEKRWENIPSGNEEIARYLRWFAYALRVSSKGLCSRSLVPIVLMLRDGTIFKKWNGMWIGPWR